MNALKFLLGYEKTIYLISSVSSLLFALVIFSLIRSARILQEKRWAEPFAQTFLVLAFLYLLRFIGVSFPQYNPTIYLFQFTTHPIDIVIYLCSGLTNYLFLLTAFLLVQPSIENQRLRKLIDWVAGSNHLRNPLFWILLTGGLVGIFGRYYTSPDLVFSAVALTVTGFVLYRNISVRRDKLMAWVALLSAVGYAVLYVFRGLYFIISIPHPSGTETGQIVKLTAILISLVLKFGLFFPGYFLMLLISGPLQGIDRLLVNVTRRQREYLESDGLIKSICEELRTTSVSLYIKLPDLKRKQLALYFYPSNNGFKRTPQEFPYREVDTYHPVMTSGLTQRTEPENTAHPLIPSAPRVGVPVFFHDSVIACLEVELGKERFTEVDQINLERIATLISPAVQTFRELAALNKISQDAAQLQLEIVDYDPERDIEALTEIFHNVISPLAIGISIDIGFAEHRSTHSQDDFLEALIKGQLEYEGPEELLSDRNSGHRWLRRALTISMDSAGKKVGEQVFGKLVFAIDRSRRSHPTLGTNAAALRAISNLLTDTLLRFVRGHLNQLTDKLGVQLGGLKSASVESWLAEVEGIAQEAQLLWAVARCIDESELMGREDSVDLIKRLEINKDGWVSKNDDMWLHTLERPQWGTHHIIKKSLERSKATLWLGVGRKGFGRELDYVSPWRYFLDHFCEIADSSLRATLDTQARTEQMAEVQSITTTLITTASIIHELKNRVGVFAMMTKDLEIAMNGHEHDKALISDFQSEASKINSAFNMVAQELARDERRPCSLKEAVGHALHLANFSIVSQMISVNDGQIPSELMIDVPFCAATNALAIVIDNAKDAIKYSGTRNGEILIGARVTEDLIICDVSNNGPPIPEEIVKTLMKKVSKSNKPTSHGVGLYISAYLLRVYGGDIILKHSGPKPPTTFRIQFPKFKNSLYSVSLDVNQ